jgi:hypothetical protein
MPDDTTGTVNFTIRDVPRDVVDAIDNEAALQGVSRNGLLVRLLVERFGASDDTILIGQAIKGFNDEGGVVLIRFVSNSKGVNELQTGARNISSAQHDAFRLACDHAGQGGWGQARRILEEAGFNVFKT